MRPLIILFVVLVLQGCASTIVQTEDMKIEQKKMSDWLMSPLEFGEKPTNIKTIFTKQSFWPFTDDKKQVYLHEYTISGQGTFVGFSGPITFSILGMNYKQFTHEQLVQIYIGWYTAFKINEKHDVVKGVKTCQYIEGLLSKIDFIVKRCDNISYEDFSYSAVVGDMGDAKDLVVFSEGEKIDLGNIINLYDFDNLPPLYFYLGKKFNETK